MSTVLSIINEFCDRVNQPREASIVGSSTPAARQFLSLFNFIGRELLSMPATWAQLKRVYSFTIRTGVSLYQLPGDFDKPLTGTQWGVSTQIPLSGPISNQQVAYQTYGIAPLSPYSAYQFNGAQGYIFNTSPYTQRSAGYFEIVPPGQNNTDVNVIAYQSSNFVWPRDWVTGTAYIVGDIRTGINNMYRVTAITTGTSGTVRPSLSGGIAQDGTVYWAVVSAWVALTQYAAGTYVNSNSKIYLCTTAGTSSSTGPSHTSGSATDGTVTWQYISTPGAWASSTLYNASTDYVTSNSKFYRCVGTGTSDSASGPNFTATTQIDGGVTWTPYYEPYTALNDSDFSLLDDDLMIEGLRWAWYRSKKQDYAQERKDWDRSVRSAMGRQNGYVEVNAGFNRLNTWDRPGVPVGSWDGVGNV